MTLGTHVMLTLICALFLKTVIGLRFPWEYCPCCKKRHG
jgi:hypothetical protein